MQRFYLICKHANLSKLGTWLNEWSHHPQSSKEFDCTLSPPRATCEALCCRPCLPEPRAPGLLPSGSGCWSPAHRWGLLWSPPAGLARRGCRGWKSRDTGGRTAGTGPCSGTPCGPRLPRAWCPARTGWRCTPGTSAPWGLSPAPPTRRKGSCLPDTNGKGR